VRIAYRDTFVARLADDMAALVLGNTALRERVRQGLRELMQANCSATTDYQVRAGAAVGLPDVAFRGELLYHFPEQPPARVFLTSGTTARTTGRAACSPRGLELMELSIIESARRHLFCDLSEPVVVRLVPPASLAPEMVMAHGMECIARQFAAAELSCSVVGPSGLDLDRLRAVLSSAESARQPVVLIGATFAFVNLCEQLLQQRLSWQLAPGSRVVDAGGFKGRSRLVTVPEFRALIERCLGIPGAACCNLFGMTELASQLYDGSDEAVGPRGERPKPGTAFVLPRVRDPRTLALLDAGPGLLEVEDLCILDRPGTILSGDEAVASPSGVAVTGRVARSTGRGCSLAMEERTAGAA
jgi:hypothetical protein